jgi:hypothetical protein
MSDIRDLTIRQAHEFLCRLDKRLGDKGAVCLSIEGWQSRPRLSIGVGHTTFYLNEPVTTEEVEAYVSRVAPTVDEINRTLGI